MNLIFILCKVTSSLFFGANLVIPQIKDLSSSINKCSSTVSEITPLLCSTKRTLLNFQRDDYVAAAQALADMEYFYKNVDLFFDDFLDCLNGQNATNTTGDTTIRLLTNIKYTLDFYLITAADTRLTVSADPLGAVFGDQFKSVIADTSAGYSENFGLMSAAIQSGMDSFQSSLDGAPTPILTDDNYGSEANATFWNILSTSVKNINVILQQKYVVMLAAKTVIETSDAVQTSIKTIAAMVSENITQAAYEQDIANEAAKKMCFESTQTSTDELAAAFENFTVINAAQFSGDKDILEARGKVETFITAITAEFTSIETMFTTTATETQVKVQEVVAGLMTQVSTSVQAIVDYIAETTAISGGSLVSCMDEENLNLLQSTISTLGMNATTCISIQSNVTLRAQSLMAFIVEDVVLNQMGVADKLCGYSVKGGKKDVEITKKCIKKVR